MLWCSPHINLASYLHASLHVNEIAIGNVAVVFIASFSDVQGIIILATPIIFLLLDKIFLLLNQDVA